MQINKCLYCQSSIKVKPSHLKRGWGKYCSRVCQNKASMTGKVFKCHICSEKTYRSVKEQQRSKSGNYFCSKSCQTIWRNSLYSDEKHKNWVAGKSSYRQRLIRLEQERACKKCRNSDDRVLAVHHMDKNRSNNHISNLIWLCHNCHYLVHHFDNEARGFLVAVA